MDWYSLGYFVLGAIVGIVVTIGVLIWHLKDFSMFRP